MLDLPKGRLRVFGDYYRYSVSFDISDEMNDGQFWLQIYDSNETLISDFVVRSSLLLPSNSSIKTITRAEIIWKVYSMTNIKNKIRERGEKCHQTL